MPDPGFTPKHCITNLFNCNVMKTRTIYPILFAAVLALTGTLSAQAQFIYSESRVSVDIAPVGSYKLSVGGNGAYFKMPSQPNFFQIDISADKAHLAGHGDQIAFYNSATGRYNNIHVKNIFYQSDARAKTDIRNFSNGAAVVAQLRPVTYNFIHDQENRSRVSGPQIGLLAQEVENILPGAVTTDENGGKMLNYNALIPVLIDAVKTLQAEVAALKAAQ